MEIGNRFALVRNIGNDIETRLIGRKANGAKGADCALYEIKSKNVESTSPITLGGLANVTDEQLLEYVFAKVCRVLFVEYYVCEKFYQIVDMTLLSGLTRESLQYAGWYIEKHNGTRNVRIGKKRFLAMYGKAEKVE